MDESPLSARQLLPEALREDRLSLLISTMTVAATISAFVGGLLTWFYGYPTSGKLIVLASFTLPITLLILRRWQHPVAASHFLIANLIMQLMWLAPEREIGCMGMIAIAAGLGLRDRLSSRVWLGVIIIYSLLVAMTEPTTAESATATVAALVSAIVFWVVYISEQSRQRVQQQAANKRSLSDQQSAVLGKIVADYFDCVLLVSGNDIFSVNRSVTNLLGYDKNKFMDRPLSYYLHPDNSDLPDKLTPGQPPIRTEIRMRHANGYWRWVEAYASPDIVSGNVNRYWLVMRDYDKERKVSDQLTQAQRLEGMGRMAAAVAHDFNNMLTVISGIADGLSDPHAREEIARVAGNAGVLTNKLLAFGHGNSSSNEVHDLSDFLRARSAFLQHGIDSRYVFIESYSEEPTLVRIEQYMVEQIITNLLNNAREAMPEGGELEIALYTQEFSEGEEEANKFNDKQRRTGHFAVVEVRDTGEGMDEKTKAQIFDPFFSTKPSNGNSGLGLSSCYGIVSQHGGFMEVESEPANGTSVRVFFPIAETLDYEPTIELLDNQSSIIVVDDDPGVLKVITTTLTGAGYHVRGFTDANAALEFFRPEHIDLLITDIVMPDITGPALCERLRRSAPKLPVLFVSGYNEHDMPQTGAGERTAYLAKPFRPAEIINRVENLLGAVAPARATSRMPQLF